MIMKKLYNYFLLLMASMALVMTGCQPEEIIFDHEKAQFEIQPEAILLEVIMPNGTAADELLYITGEFCNGEKIELTKAEKSDKKWGVYLYETDFAEGKTLADGFYFVSAKNGDERTAKGETVTHTLDVAYGTRTNVWVASWEAFFKTGNETIEHDGHVIYVLDETGWDALALYGWADGLPELYGGWPGITPTGKETIKGVEYLYFDCGEANTGLGYNLIFNNNNNGEQFNGPYFTIERDIFLKLTATGAEEFTPADGEVFPTFTHDGDAIFVCNMAGWDAVALYAWGSELPELFGGWPGAQPTGTFKFKGYDWYYFDCGAANEGLFYNFIANNNNGGKQVEPLCAYELTADGIKYILISEDLKATEIEDPNTYNFGGDDPGDDPVVVPDSVTTHFYFINETTDMHYVYTYGDDVNLFGGWPGADWTAWQTATFLGQKLYCYEFTELRGLEVNGIINNNSGKQIEPAFKFEVGDQLDYFFLIGDEAVTELKPTPDNAEAIRRLFRK